MVIAAAVGMGFTAGPMADHQVRLVDESNPLAGRPFYVDPISVAMRAAKNNPDSPELAAVANTPQAYWLDQAFPAGSVAGSRGVVILNPPYALFSKCNTSVLLL